MDLKPEIGLFLGVGVYGGMYLIYILGVMFGMRTETRGKKEGSQTIFGGALFVREVLVVWRVPSQNILTPSGGSQIFLPLFS